MNRLILIGFVAVLALLAAAPAQAASGNWDRAWGKDVDIGGLNGFEICTVAANCQVGSTATAFGGEFDRPTGAATDAVGNVYVSDNNDRIQKFDSSGNFLRAWGKDVIDPTDPLDTGTGFELCVAGVNICQAAAVSTGLGGELRSPGGLDTDAAGNVYVADGDQHRIQVFDLSGNFLRAWGKDVIAPASPGNIGTGFEICVAGVNICKAGATGGLAGELESPQGAALDPAGNVYVADDGNQRIDKYDSAGNFLRAWGKDVTATGSPNDIGTGFELCLAGFDTCQPGTFGGGLGGEFAVPRGLGTDAAGNVYVADANNHRIQKFDSAGSFLRAWGKDVIDPASPGNTGTGFEICVNGVNTCKAGSDASELAGELDRPFSAATDAGGNVYVTDRFNNRIQKFDSSGNFQRAWGEDVAAAGPGNTGTGFEICVAPVDTCKIGTTVAPALGGELNLPPGLATDSAGNLYVADGSNNRIQKFADPAPPVPPITPSVQPTAPTPTTAAKKKCKKGQKLKKGKCFKKKRKKK